jgi:hypothetical protein
MTDLQRLVQAFLSEGGKTLDWSKNPGCIWTPVNNDYRVEFSVISRATRDMTWAGLINRSRPSSWTMSLFYQGKYRVDGCDLNGKHTNTGEAFRYDRHHHRQILVTGTRATLAMPLPPECPLDSYLGTINWYLRALKIAEIPEDWFSLPDDLGQGVRTMELWEF